MDDMPYSPTQNAQTWTLTRFEPALHFLVIRRDIKSTVTIKLLQTTIRFFFSNLV